LSCLDGGGWSLEQTVLRGIVLLTGNITEKLSAFWLDWRPVRRRWPVADEPYEVGFGKPPKHTQFKKGRSGNPKGRPKGSKNIFALIRKTLDANVIAKGPGGSRSMTMQEAMIRQLFNKAEMVISRQSSMSSN
jgi:hypothetical protein